MAPGGPSDAFWSHLLAWVRKWVQEAVLRVPNSPQERPKSSPRAPKSLQEPSRAHTKPQEPAGSPRSPQEPP
eukprot:10110035-Karenia_brevis.AAC.1